MLQIKNTDNTTCWWVCGVTGTLICCCGMKRCSLCVWAFGNSVQLTPFHQIAPRPLSLVLIQGMRNVCPCRNLHTDVCISFIYNCQNFKATKNIYIFFKSQDFKYQSQESRKSELIKCQECRRKDSILSAAILDLGHGREIRVRNGPTHIRATDM